MDGPIQPKVVTSSAGGPGFFERINGEWHKPALQFFMIIVLGHWAEHLAQATQIHILHWPRPSANGVLGL